MSSGPLFVQGVTITHVFDPTAIPGELIFCHHVFKFTPVKLSKSPLLGDADLLTARELELGPAEGLSHMLLVLQVGADRHKELAGVDPGHFTLGLSKGNTHTCLEPRLGPVMNVHWKGLPPRSLRATCTDNRLHTLRRRLLSAATAHWVPRGRRVQGWKNSLFL